MNNYEFCCHWASQKNPKKVLDYGCGQGSIVKLLRLKNVDAYGCDIFYEGGDYTKEVDSSLFQGNIIKKMNNGKIPFESSSFDIVINNQVMEHVEDLNAVLIEINRVLKPNGRLLSIFPDRSVLREGHCGIALAHWFKKGSRIRFYYVFFFRALGFGYHKGQKSVKDWTKDFCYWLDTWTHYRGKNEINESFTKHFGPLNYIEEEWFNARFYPKSFIIKFTPSWLKKIVVNKLGGLVFWVEKPNNQRQL